MPFTINFCSIPLLNYLSSLITVYRITSYICITIFFQELLKMVGMKSWMLWLGWFIYGMIPMLLSVMFIVVLMKVPLFGTEYPPIEHTNFLILFVFLVLYCMAATIFCFSISSLFKKRKNY